MYSVVLMAALTTGGASVDFGHHGGWGCCGYCGGCYGGYGCDGYWGCVGCHGCYGGYGYGYGGYGCYGYYTCYGCYGGGCYGYNCHGCYGGTGFWNGCQGCYGFNGFSGYAPAFATPAPAMPAAPADATPVDPTPMKKTSATRARLVVQVPADAKLYIDGNLMKTTSGTRTFNTPLLQPGQAYFYDIRAEVVRDGETKTETRRVIIRPGELASASFPNLETATTATSTTASR
jgi:uncharacterized protein (TIGR03000 family)